MNLRLGDSYDAFYDLAGRDAFEEPAEEYLEIVRYRRLAETLTPIPTTPRTTDPSTPPETTAPRDLLRPQIPTLGRNLSPGHCDS